MSENSINLAFEYIYESVRTKEYCSVISMMIHLNVTNVRDNRYEQSYVKEFCKSLKTWQRLHQLFSPLVKRHRYCVKLIFCTHSFTHD